MAEYRLDNADVCFPLLAVSKFRRCIRLEAAASSLNRALLARASGSPVPLPRRPDGSGEGYHGGLLLPGRWGGPAAGDQTDLTTRGNRKCRPLPCHVELCYGFTALREWWEFRSQMTVAAEG